MICQSTYCHILVCIITLYKEHDMPINLLSHTRVCYNTIFKFMTAINLHNNSKANVGTKPLLRVWNFNDRDVEFTYKLIWTSFCRVSPLLTLSFHPFLSTCIPCPVSGNCGYLLLCFVSLQTFLHFLHLVQTQ